MRGIISDPILCSTYRLQFNHECTFKKVFELIPYFHKLGISHLYASPLFKARKGSMHGYDVVDYQKLNPEIGSYEEFKRLIDELHKHQMGFILDIVPNHMAGDLENPWWKDLLENGNSSPFVDFFDVDWHPDKKGFQGKIYLPLLEQSFGEALENGKIRLDYQQGNFILVYQNLRLPTSLESWMLILNSLKEKIEISFSKDELSIKKLQNLIEFAENISQKKNEERASDKKRLKNELRNYFETNKKAKEALLEHLKVLNGIIENPKSFDELEKFVQAQHYRLCFWKVANSEINYRRFFDVFEYASIRIEVIEVFKAVHEKVFEFLEKSLINGLRIDHIDGLWDPQKYLDDLHKFTPHKIPYLIVEKILTGNELLQDQWAIQGSVGYDFLNQLNNLYVYQENKKSIIEIYKNFIGNSESVDLKYHCKKMILQTLLSSELNLLLRRLCIITEKHRESQDFSIDNLKDALIEIIACFPVYRSYIQAKNGKIDEEDQKYIIVSVKRAKKLNRGIDSSIFNFIQNILLLQYPKGINELKDACDDFVMHFQQVTGPVMAKGYEDTASYRFFPLSSLNEVGGDLNLFGMQVENFHKKNLERYEKYPLGLLSTTTHDTKRGEDVRARINVLSEIPEVWQLAIEEWKCLNHDCKTILDDVSAPSCNDEYLLYQTLIGTWPFEESTPESWAIYITRIQKYLEKAINEAKVESSWLEVNDLYLQATKEFIERILERSASNRFLEKFESFFKKIKHFGMLNSLSQTIIKMTCPGIPDLYQGNEIWDLSLVDPDNRRPVDFAKRQKLIENLEGSLEHLNSYKQTPEDGSIKLFIINQTLKLRKEFPQLFQEGSYIPLSINGDNDLNLIAFARHLPERQISVIILSARFFAGFMNDFTTYKNKSIWEKMTLDLPFMLANHQYQDIFNQKKFYLTDTENCIKDLFTTLPFTVLVSLE